MCSSVALKPSERISIVNCHHNESKAMKWEDVFTLSTFSWLRAYKPFHNMLLWFLFCFLFYLSKKEREVFFCTYLKYNCTLSHLTWVSDSLIRDALKESCFLQLSSVDLLWCIIIAWWKCISQPPRRPDAPGRLVWESSTRDSWRGDLGFQYFLLLTHTDVRHAPVTRVTGLGSRLQNVQASPPPVYGRRPQ